MRRGFHEALGEGWSAAWLLGQIGKLYAVEKHLREQKAGPQVRAAVRAWQSRPIRQKITQTLEAHPKGGGDHRLPHDGQMMQGVVEAQREADDQQRGPDFHFRERAREVRRREAAQHDRGRQRRTLQFDHRHVDRPPGIAALPPDAPAVPIEQHGQPRRPGEVRGVGMEFNDDPVGVVPAGLVQHHMPAGDQEEPVAARKEESTRPGEEPVVVVGRDAGGG